MDEKFDIKIIKSKSQYSKYLFKVEQLMESDPAANSPNGQLLETLTVLIEDYEKKQGWEIPQTVHPIEVIKNRMDALSLKQTDLAEIMGDKTIVSRILNGSRKLTYSMIMPLSNLLRVPPEFLLEK
jgi:HTH-type transcriptional regulator / antitoxin HigA